MNKKDDKPAGKMSETTDRNKSEDEYIFSIDEGVSETVLVYYIQEFKDFSYNEIIERFLSDNADPESLRIIPLTDRDTAGYASAFEPDLRYSVKDPEYPKDPKKYAQFIQVSVDVQLESYPGYALMPRILTYAFRIYTSQALEKLETTSNAYNYDKSEKAVSYMINMSPPKKLAGAIIRGSLDFDMQMDLACPEEYKNWPEYQEMTGLKEFKTQTGHSDTSIRAMIINVGPNCNEHQFGVVKFLYYYLGRGIKFEERKKVLEEEFGFHLTKKQEDNMKKINSVGAQLAALSRREGEEAARKEYEQERQEWEEKSQEWEEKSQEWKEKEAKYKEMLLSTGQFTQEDLGDFE